MKSLGRRHALVGFGVTLAACTPEQKIVTQSNAVAGPRRKLGHVLIVIAASSSSLTELQNAALLQVAELKRSFEEKWPPLGISVEIVDAAQAAVTPATFKANQVLTLHPGRGTRRGNFVQDYEIAANLYETSSKRVVWRGATELSEFFKVSHTPSNRPIMADRYVDSLTATLREDGFI